MLEARPKGQEKAHVWPPLLWQLNSPHHSFCLPPLHSPHCCPSYSVLLHLLLWPDTRMLPPRKLPQSPRWMHVIAMCQDLCPGSKGLGKQIFGDSTFHYEWALFLTEAHNMRNYPKVIRRFRWWATKDKAMISIHNPEKRTQAFPLAFFFHFAFFFPWLSPWARLQSVIFLKCNSRGTWVAQLG